MTCGASHAGEGEIRSGHADFSSITQGGGGGKKGEEKKKPGVLEMQLSEAMLCTGKKLRA